MSRFPVTAIVCGFRTSTFFVMIDVIDVRDAARQQYPSGSIVFAAKKDEHTTDRENAWIDVWATGEIQAALKRCIGPDGATIAAPPRLRLLGELLDPDHDEGDGIRIVWHTDGPNPLILPH